MIFYNEWLKLFPEFTSRPVIISGESYGGHYIPAWSDAILNYNDAHASSAINLKGVIIGNGCVNNTVQNTDTFIQFQHESNLIPSTSKPKNRGAAEAEMIGYIGYTPNYYDYRIESVTCSACYSYNYTAWSYWFLQSEVLDALHVCGDAGNDAFAGNAGGCISMGAFDSRDKFDYSGALGRVLNAGIPVSVYYGKTDTACDYVGGKTMAESIVWENTHEYQAASLISLEIAGIKAGAYKSYKGLSYYEIESAGHMVPMDQPISTSVILTNMLNTIV